MKIQKKCYFLLTVSGFLFFLLACDSPVPTAEPSTPASSNTVTQDKFDRIKVDFMGNTGMTIDQVRDIIDEVLEIMGFKESIRNESKLSSDLYLTCIWQQKLSNNKLNIITVRFRNGRAIMKTIFLN